MRNDVKVIIAAGGKGTRIASIHPDIPKPLIPLCGKPVLEWEIDSLRKQGFWDITLTVSHMAEKIIDYFGDGSKWGVKLTYFTEEVPMGNAGALYKIPDLDKDFLFLNADSLFNVDFVRFLKYHYEKGGLATILTHPNSHPYDSGLVIESNGVVTSWLTKESQRPKWYKNRVNAGLHILSKEALNMASVDPKKIGEEVDGKRYKVDLDRDILRPLCGTGKLICYDSPEYVKDMGTPERYYRVNEDIESGIVEAKNLNNKQKAIFLDRDGTINKYVGFLRKEEEFELIPGVAEAIKMINESGYLAVVVTNQPVIARGEVTLSQLQTIHNKMETLLGEEGAYIDGLFFCPHHPDKGYEGEIAELKVNCECRKPKPGMLLSAAQKMNIDLGQSWMVGDGENDILAGQAAGCKTVLLGNGNYGQDYEASDLLDFVKRVLG